MRLSVGMLAGLAFSLGLFSLLHTLVSAELNIGPQLETRRIEFSRQRADSDLQSKRDEKVEREKPPPAPEIPQLALNRGGLDGASTAFTPMIDPRSALSKMTMSAGSDREVLPLVRIPPEYPARAASRGIEGWVQVQFTISVTGQVKNPVVVKSEPGEIFDDAALKAISRWRYNPKVEGGVAVERVGVQTVIRFELEK
ncbi:MAG: energy transducer TonB [Rhodospirillaceae bacterium]|nr:energy transducer TonB [Rhodospirillaceae bacterium]